MAKVFAIEEARSAIARCKLATLVDAEKLLSFANSIREEVWGRYDREVFLLINKRAGAFLSGVCSREESETVTKAYAKGFNSMRSKRTSHKKPVHLFAH